VIRVWEKTGSCFQERGGVFDRLASHINTLLTDPHGTWLAAATEDGELVVWRFPRDGDKPQRQHLRQDGNSPIKCLATDAEGRWLYLGEGVGHGIYRWDLGAPNAPAQFVGTQKAYVIALAVDPTGETLFASTSSSIICFNVGREEGPFPQQVFVKSRRPFYDVAMADGGVTLVASNDDGSVYVWDLRSPTPSKSQMIFRPGRPFLRAVAVAKTKKLFVGGEGVWEYDLDFDRVLGLSRRMVGRELSEAERTRFDLLGDGVSVNNQ
jgi:WD40 repeat protein